MSRFEVTRSTTVDASPERVHSLVNDFLILPAGASCEVTWRMTGEQKGLAALFGKIYPMDKLVGGDFERGPAQLKSAAEA